MRNEELKSELLGIVKIEHGDVRAVFNDMLTELLSRMEQPSQEHLKEALENYIEYLEKYLRGLSGYLYAHSMLPDDETVKKGEELREKIEIATKALNQK